ncbi:methyltransferase family protein [Hyphococcus sp.]|uniref:methyltransferase family protein n=1 Tax=Hyphococcus sp. TaxID=2038636 RepID=UPI0035C6FE6B
MVRALLIVTAVNAALSIPMAMLVKRDFAERGRVSLPMAVWTGAAMHGNALLLFAIAWFDRGSFGDQSKFTVAAGVFFAFAGAMLIYLGRSAYADFSRVYGLKEDELIDRGVYRWSRNPQYVGYALFLGGVSLAALSVWAFVLTLSFALFIHCYIVSVEEPHLRVSFGKAYGAYVKRTARYIGLPSGRRHNDVNEKL